MTEIWAIKAAFLLFYGNLFTRGHITGLRLYALYATAVLIPLAYVSSLVLVLTVCSPISLNW